MRWRRWSTTSMPCANTAPVGSFLPTPDELRRSFARRAPGTRVCIQGQARFSEAELERARQAVGTPFDRLFKLNV